MADDNAMSEGMAGLGLAGGASAAEPDVSAPPVVVPPVNTHTAANPNADSMAAGSMGVSESIPAPSVVPAVSRIAPTAREAITSAGARIAASAVRIPPMLPTAESGFLIVLQEKKEKKHINIKITEGISVAHLSTLT
jgi:hypothetical protein